MMRVLFIIFLSRFFGNGDTMTIKVMKSSADCLEEDDKFIAYLIELECHVQTWK